ncbi:hypothetical protein [Flindersiella endophytica]
MLTYGCVAAVGSVVGYLRGVEYGYPLFGYFLGLLVPALLAVPVVAFLHSALYPAEARGMSYGMLAICIVVGGSGGAGLMVWFACRPDYRPQWVGLGLLVGSVLGTAVARFLTKGAHAELQRSEAYDRRHSPFG